MRKSSRSLLVAFWQLMSILGLAAVPTQGQSAPLTVLDWVPPNAYLPPTTTITSLNTGNLINNSKSGTIPIWVGTDVSPPPPASGATYTFAMVGTDPTVKSSTTTIDVKIVPIRFSISSPALVFDAENNDACSPKKTPALNMVQGSPMFTQVSLSVGKGQFGSLFQRANFWYYTQTTTKPNGISPNYGIVLNQTLVNRENLKTNTIPITSTTSYTAPYSILGNVLTNFRYHHHLVQPNRPDRSEPA